MNHIFRKLLKRISHPILKRLQDWYLSKPRWYSYKGIHVRILPSVFHPGYLLSTKILLKYLQHFDLYKKSLLDLGAGSGLIALHAAKNGAIVTATDINPVAIKAIQESMEKNQLFIQVIESDLFQNIPSQFFDYILINPPYYPKQANNYEEMAFFCGPNFEYFTQLFSQISTFLWDSNKTLMILSEDCEIKTIEEIGLKNRIIMTEIYKTKTLGEINYIFELTKLNQIDLAK